MVGTEGFDLRPLAHPHVKNTVFKLHHLISINIVTTYQLMNEDLIKYQPLSILL